MSIKEERKKVRSYLRQYRIIKQERDVRLSEYNKNVKNMYDPMRSIVLDGAPKSKYKKSDITGNTAVEVWDYSAELKKEKEQIDRLEAEIFKIESIIGQLDYRERGVLYFIYIQGMDWDELSDYTHYQRTQNYRYEVRGIDEIIRRGLYSEANKSEQK